MVLLSVNLKSFYLVMLFLVCCKAPVTARTSDSMFYPLILCALQIVFMIMNITEAYDESIVDRTQNK